MKKLYIFLLCLILVSCSEKTVKPSSQKFINHVPFPKSTTLQYKEKIDEGTIYLYKDKSGFRHAFSSNDFKIWFNSGNGVVNPKDGFDWTMNNVPDVPIVTFGGVITRDDIVKVMVKQKTMEKEAKIIKTKQGVRVWFTTFKILEDADKGKPDQLKIEAYSRDGKLIWKDGVY
ncbi:hypothetical protein [Bacillus sp. EAC]|uniref:hypothetical protein n=1 Tax=Bacillus sp. EAC TaxID=1978338 RepID=UPI000B43DA6C|nr:hypothetical protein [Bacillus sp. EAC]